MIGVRKDNAAPENSLPASPDAWNTGTVADFLEFWLTNQVLQAEDQTVLDHYYRSYKQHFGPYLQHWYSRQTEELNCFVKQAPGSSVLEVGCGCGTESLWLALHGARVVAIDISQQLLTVAQRRQQWLEHQIGQKLDCQFLCRSITDTDDFQEFDFVYMEQAFHHMEPRAAVIENTARLVADGGRLIISEANAWNVFVQLHLLRLRGTKTIMVHEGRPWGHERVTVPAALIRQFGRHGLIRERLEYYRTLPNVRAADRFLWLDKKLPAVLKPLFTHFNLVLRKLPA